ncbi:MAG TPA: hypothetical protein VGQ56_17465 [Gemmatimonadaceae bacterium]|jgi:hypothetical protein|nr:hypothetical protein [Gemmatimonadaceae bacterium]
MSAENDNLEPRDADVSVPANRPADRAIEMQPVIADREVVRPRDDAQPADASPVTEGDATALFESHVLDQFKERWAEIQTGFVDEPRRAVQQADALVSDVIKRIADSFGRERADLERQWDRGDNVSTEDLRVALQRYRDFFSRLLTL